MIRKFSLATLLLVLSYFAFTTPSSSSLQELRTETENWLNAGAPSYPQPTGLKPTEYADWYVGHIVQCGARVAVSNFFISRLFVPTISTLTLYTSASTKNKHTTSPAAIRLGSLIELFFVLSNIDQALAPSLSFNTAKQLFRHFVFWNFDGDHIAKPMHSNPVMGILNGGSAITLKVISDSNQIFQIGQFPSALTGIEQVQMNLWMGEFSRFYVRSKTLPLVLFEPTCSALFPHIRIPRSWHHFPGKSYFSEFWKKIPLSENTKAYLPVDMVFNTERMLNNRDVNFNVWGAVRSHVFFWEETWPTSLTSAIKMPLRTGYNTIKLPIRFTYDTYLLLDELTGNVN